MGREATLRAAVASEFAVVPRACAQAQPKLSPIAWPFIAYGILMLWCLSGTGCCRLLNLAYRTTQYEPGLYCAGCDETDSLALYSNWADEAWCKETDCCVDPAILPDYRLGFRAGFVDYCYAGGTGEPPPVPPRIYWNIEGRLADGKACARAWFDGYRHGARVARDGGYRESAVVQSSTAVHHSRLECPNAGLAQRGEFGPSFVSPPVESLPTPGATPRNEEPNSVQPAEPPRGSLPELTPPTTGSPADGAGIKNRNRRVQLASFVAKPAAKAAGDEGAAPGNSGNGWLSNRCDAAVRGSSAQHAAAAPKRKATDELPSSNQAIPEQAERDATPKAPPANQEVRTIASDCADVGTATPCPQNNNRTTLVFKSIH